MHDLPQAGSRSHGRASAFVATVVAVTLLVIAPLAPGPFGCAGRARRRPGDPAAGHGDRPARPARSTATCRTGASTPGPSTGSTTTWSRRSRCSGSGSRRTATSTWPGAATTAYLSDNAAAVTNAAHAKGVRVVPTFQLFDSGTLPEDDGVPPQQDRPGALHQAGPGAHGAPLGRRRELRLRADAASRCRSTSSTFLTKFKAAMVKEFPKAKLVVATIGRGRR